MAEQLDISVEGNLGVIALNRPQAINALSREMIDGITGQLVAWRDDDAIRAVLFEARGERGFCAGGDVRAVRQLVLEGKPEAAAAYFAAEYQMNRLIAGFPKPVIALADGVVMGGGIGIAGHAAFRFTTPDARYAMPEAAIGFVADVGVNAILAKAPLHRALLFLMSGLPVAGGDALALGLADCAVTPERMAEVRSSLPDAAAAGRIDTALVALMQSVSIEPGEPALCRAADRLAGEFDIEDAESIVAGIRDAAADDPELAPIAKALASRSPTSLEAIVQSHLAARKLQDLESILALDLRLARLLSGWPDFAEGVRAVLLDKDQLPRWQPPTFAGVPRAAIAAAVEPAEMSVAAPA
jgi:enoyl-CoA hydratase